MPRAVRSDAPRDDAMKPGDEVEVRVAQAWFWEGSFARRGVSLQRHFREPLQVTDLDLLAIDFDARLQPHRIVGESKSGGSKSGPRPLDRVIWLRGLMDLLGDVEAGELTTATRYSAQVRELAKTLNVTVQSLDDLTRREDRLRYNGFADRGSQGVTAFKAAERARRAANREPELDRLYWLVRGDVWHMTPWMAVKRLLAAIGDLRAQFAPAVNDERQFAVRWLLAETVSIFTLQLVAIGGYALTVAPGEFTALVADQLADPGVDIRRMQKLSNAVDKYMAGVLRQANVEDVEIAKSMGAFMPTAPEYADAFAETARRLSQRPEIARVLPRFVDLVMHEGFVRRAPVDLEIVKRLGSSDDSALSRGGRLVAAFLAGQAGLPREAADVLSVVPDGESVAVSSVPPPPASRQVEGEAARASVEAGKSSHARQETSANGPEGSGQMTWTEPRGT